MHSIKDGRIALAIVAWALVCTTASSARAELSGTYEVNGGWAHLMIESEASSVGWEVPNRAGDVHPFVFSIDAPLGISVSESLELGTGALDMRGTCNLNINGRDVTLADLSFVRWVDGTWFVKDNGALGGVIFGLANVRDEIKASSWSYDLRADVIVNEDFARRMGTPDAANMPIGEIRIMAGLSRNGGSQEDDSPVAGGQGNPGPDVIVGDLTGPQNYNSVVGGIKPYAVGTTSCNIGTDNLDWYDFGTATPTLHPVIGQNMYRLKDGRFEHIGQSWLKHGFCALQGQLCSSNCDAFCGGCCNELGPGCSDPYSSVRNGDQTGLGPKWEINPAAGQIMVWPYSTPGTGNAINGRIQVHVSDLNPASNEGALYFLEGQYVTQDDANADNDWNNASYRRIAIDPGDFDATFIGSTQRKAAGIVAWRNFDEGVEVLAADIPNDGRFIIAYKTSDNGDGTWHYEYAVFNLNSTRAMNAFSVPVPEGVVVSNVGFHDVDYHSAGMPYDLTDWVSPEGSGNVSWEAVDRLTNTNANALRWGTLYNYRFDANTPPTEAIATMTLHLPLGTEDTVDIDVVGPSAAISDLTIVSSDPLNDAIDARQPSELDGSNPTGWSSLEITFDGDVSGILAADFSVSQEGGIGPAPSVSNVNIIGVDTVEVVLDSFVEPGAWTTITHVDGGAVRLGYLPADVNSDATASGSDILALIDALNGQSALPMYSTDIDRSGANTASDVLRTVDLLTGADAFDPWNLVSLPN